MSAHQKVENILLFPPEVLRMIFCHVRDHRQLSLVCQAFHQISCEYKYFDLRIRNINVHGTQKLLDKDEIFCSMLKSNRRIKNLVMEGDSRFFINEHPFQRLTEIAQHFGKHIKSLQIIDIRLPPNIIKLVHFMPNLEKLLLDSVYPDPIQGIRWFAPVELSELREILSYDSIELILSIFKTILPGSLRKVKISELSDCDPSIKLFESPENIEDMEMSGDFGDLVHLKKLKLMSLKIYNSDLRYILFNTTVPSK